MSKKSKDPFYERESEKYTDPVPSREFIIEILNEYGKPMSRNQLFEKLHIGDERKQESMGFRLKAMLRDGQIMQDRRGRFCLMQRINLSRGMVQAHPDGFGFLFLMMVQRICFCPLKKCGQ